MKPFTSLFLYSSFFISFTAAAMCWQSYNLLHQPVSLRIIAIVFCGTLAGYNLHFFFQRKNMRSDDYSNWLNSHASLLITLGIAAFLGVIALAYPMQQTWKPLGIAVIIHALYSLPVLINPKKISIKYFGIVKPLVLSAGWAYATLFIAYPFYDKTSLAIGGMRFLMLLPLALLFDYRDKENDKENGIYTPANLFGDYFTKVAVYVCAGLVITGGYFTSLLFMNDSFFYSCGAQMLLLTFWDPMGPSNKTAKYYLFYIDGLLLVSPVVSFIFELLGMIKQ